MEKLIKQIENYIPYNEQEEIDKITILQALKTQENILTRENPFMHMSCSCWVTNPNRDKILMIYHKIYDSWSWLGGHADGESDLLSVACKELKEESGISNYRIVDEIPFSIEVLTVDGHIKKGSYVSSHLHLNVTYLFEVDEDECLIQNEVETNGVKWIDMDHIEHEVSEVWFMENIYKKLINKLKGVKS